MEKRNNVALKIVQLILIIAGVLLMIFSLSVIANDSTVNGALPLPQIVSVLKIIAFVSGLVYFAMEAKKNASNYYKSFMWFVAVAVVISNSYIASLGEFSNILNATVYNISLALFVVLALGKDLGKVYSYIFSLVLVLAAAYLTLYSANKIDVESLPSIRLLCENAGQLFLAGTTALMVCGKYTDKDSRGAK